MARSLELLREQGQSVWLDFIRRALLTSGDLYHMVEDRTVTGVTSNPTIFRKAISGSTDYDQALRELARQDGITPYEAFLSVGGEDIRLAADALRPVYDETQGVDGYVSFEAQNGTPAEIIAEVRRMFVLVDRPNVMIKVPGTPTGVEAVADLIAEGINVNVTLLFDIDVYRQVAEAYIAGIERRHAAGQPLDTVASVASFFVSRVDTKVDDLLPEASPLRGKIAVANARAAYGNFQELFGSERWQRLAAAGARVQRPLWGSTGTKNPAYSDVLYVEELIAPNTVNTLPEATLQAFIHHGRVAPTVIGRTEAAKQTLAAARAAGIDYKAVTRALLDEGLAAFEKDFEGLLSELDSKLTELRTASPPRPQQIGALQDAVDRRLATFLRDRTVQRIWTGDHTVWKDDPTEITAPNRLGWLTVVDEMTDETARLRAFADAVVADGLRHVVVLGMGGSSLAPEVLATTFPPPAGRPSLHVLDTTDPDAILALERGLELARTLFVVASKSGTTVETLSHYAYFWDKVRDGSQFVAITDAGTPLASLAEQHGFRKLFLNPPEIGGRYSALSYFGLVPAALIGVDLDALLDSAHEMLHACHYCVPVAENPGAWLGAVIGEAALAGRDKLTLVLPEEIAALGDWLEQLLAESTGKEGKGIVPVAGEALGAPAVYGDDRFFVALGDQPGLDALEAAGQPVVRLPYAGKQQLGAEFFRWQFATAVAGSVLAINPFDQPDVQAAKDATARVLASGSSAAIEAAEDLRGLDGLVKHGDYVAIQAYLPRNAANDRALQELRLRLRDRFRVATTLGYGPRFLHSTGQLHKGGPASAVSVQIVAANREDVAIPDQRYTFGTLQRAQADGDLETLRKRGRRALRVQIGADADTAIRRLAAGLT